MKIEITQKKIIFTNTLLFVISFIFVRFSDIFRMHKDLHWIYTFANLTHLIIFPTTIFLSLILAFNSYSQIKQRKILYILLSLSPIILFLLLFIFSISINH